jgi:IrrE N-terminal-like domain
MAAAPEISREEVAACARAARRAVALVERDAPEPCRTWRVPVRQLAHMLDMTIEVRANLDAPARWHHVRTGDLSRPRLFDDQQSCVDLILVRADVEGTARRFAIAHEIGHAVLHRRCEARTLSARLQEEFAHAFAHELLIPRVHRQEIRSQFRAASNPAALLALAGSLGVSARTLLLRADAENWLTGIDRAWLDVRFTVNRHTGRDRRARVHRVVVDRHRWLIPSNRSIAGLLGDDGWLSQSGRHLGIEGRMDVSRWVHGERPRFVHHGVPVRVDAFRMSRPSARPGMEILACTALGV